MRGLLCNLPRRILREMEQRTTTGLEVCLVCRQEFVSMPRCTRAGNRQ
jgi:alpha-D-ribose 1-methylphosphonate 5-triphosphate synthase subunit PhnH